MTERRQWLIVGGLGAVYLVGLGVLAGIVSERFRFDGIRNQIVHQLEAAREHSRAKAMASEHEVRGDAPPAAAPHTEPATWATRLQEVETALGHRDVSAAERAWRDAYGEALRTRSWRPLVEVGDAALRIGTVAGHRRPYVAKAREVYLAALLRARADRSRQGVLSVAEAFDALGDREAARQCLIMAESFGGRRDAEADARGRAVPSRFVDANAGPLIEP